LNFGLGVTEERLGVGLTDCLGVPEDRLGVPEEVSVTKSPLTTYFSQIYVIFVWFRLASCLGLPASAAGSPMPHKNRRNLGEKHVLGDFCDLTTSRTP